MIIPEKSVNTLNNFLSCPILSLTVGLGLTSATISIGNVSSVLAQVPAGIQPTLQNRQTISQVNRLFVNSSVGNDQTGNGSAIAPWRTITQALEASPPNSVIILAPGTYSTKTGEVFPLMLKPGVAIQGDVSNQGKTVTIAGGGEYLSRRFGGQNVAIVGANQTSLTGVTVTNSNSRGYGLWIESSNIVVGENTFTNNTQDGIAVTGDGTPSISKNLFIRNGANGITISGNARPEIRENIFKNTGFGINIAQNSAPVVVGNQIENNRSGIIVQATATPLLRNNLIQGNTEDGLVVIAQARPDLGISYDPGKNVFRNNGRYDINAKTAKIVISAAGNNLTSNRISGQVDLQGTNTPLSSTATLPRTAVINPNLRETIVPRTVKTVPNPNQLPPVTNSQGDSPQFNYIQPDSGAIEFVAPQGRGENLPNSNPIANSQGYPITGQNVRYRVLVLVANQQQQSLVASLVSGAFTKVWQGQRVMQVGVFRTQEGTAAIVSLFNSKGLKTVVEPFN
ncbi:MAG: DUF1565 domain-containing protein [Cuspidothrix sp.]